MTLPLFLNMQTTPVSSNSDPSGHLVKLSLNWSRGNNMICNPTKCKELVVRKKNNNMQYEQICNITRCYTSK